MPACSIKVSGYQEHCYVHLTLKYRGRCEQSNGWIMFLNDCLGEGIAYFVTFPFSSPSVCTPIGKQCDVRVMGWGKGWRMYRYIGKYKHPGSGEAGKEAASKCTSSRNVSESLSNGLLMWLLQCFPYLLHFRLTDREHAWIWHIEIITCGCQCKSYVCLSKL